MTPERPRDPHRARMDALIGLPFLLLPGKPADHVVAGQTHEGQKIRVAAVQQVWNDMLLIDAVQGTGEFSKAAGPTETACIEIGERLYGVTPAECLAAWLTLPKLRRPYEWQKPADERSISPARL